MGVQSGKSRFSPKKGTKRRLVLLTTLRGGVSYTDIQKEAGYSHPNQVTNELKRLSCDYGYIFERTRDRPQKITLVGRQYHGGVNVRIFKALKINRKSASVCFEGVTEQDRRRATFLGEVSGVQVNFK